jgi:endonuclease/exonuclease/phosphatase family metal-dependent hydrolase
MRGLWRAGIATVLIAASATLVGALDQPISGRKLCLRASALDADRRHLRFISNDAAIQAPFADPTAGATLIVRSSAAAGQCFAEIALDPSRWTALRGDGAAHGYLYTAPAPGTQGVRSIRLRAGKLSISARGAGFPCTLTAQTQQVPVTVELRLAGQRYCAAFGGSIERNRPGRFRALGAVAPAACPDSDVTVANLNILHGLPCADPAHCRLPDRLALLFQFVADRGCPDVVTLQEVPDVSPTFTALPLIETLRVSTCPFPYTRVFFRTFGIDDEMILSRYPVLTSQSQPLLNGFRHITHARIDHPVGPLDVYSTHLSASSDGGNGPCASCPAECVTAGAVTNRDCQAVQLASFVESTHDVNAPAIITGDFNSEPASFIYDQFVDRGWADTYLTVGNPECVPATGIGCTSGRDDSLTELESTAINMSERIDYIFLVPPQPSSACVATIDSLLDADGDGTATRLFADVPNPFAPTCGPLPDPICWVSDHIGVQADVDCID